MSAKNKIEKGWSTKFVFYMAAIGSAVGLGNIWRFPFLAGEHGGSAFILVYLACIIIVGFPLLIAELTIGRLSRHSAVECYRNIATKAGRSPHWGAIGVLGTISVFLILTFYSVIGGWFLAYLPVVTSGGFHGVGTKEAESLFNSLTSNPFDLVLYQGIFLLITTLIVAFGVKKGIGSAVKILMPIFFGMLLFLAIFNSAVGDFEGALKFLFEADFSKFSSNTILAAVGQAFFSIGITGVMMVTYGAYMPQNANISKAGAVIVFADTLVAIIAGLAIFPLVFGYGLTPTQGPELLFVSLPIALGQMTGGDVFAIIFYLLGFFAALTSSIAFLEVPVAWLAERTKYSRFQVASVLGLAAFLLGVPSALSFNVWDKFFPLAIFERFKTTPLLELMNSLTGDFVLPILGILVAIFAGWVADHRLIKSQIGFKNPLWFLIWRFLVRFVSPLGIGILLFLNF